MLDTEGSRGGVMVAATAVPLSPRRPPHRPAATFAPPPTREYLGVVHAPQSKDTTTLSTWPVTSTIPIFSVYIVNGIPSSLILKTVLPPSQGTLGLTMIEKIYIVRHGKSV